MTRVIIADGLVFTGEEVLAPGTVVLEGDKVVQICAGEGAAPPAGAGDRRINAAGRLVTPGLINAHTHCYSALARGIPLKDAPPTCFLENLEKLWWRLDRALSLEDIDLSARLHAVDCLRAGVTTIFDHHASQRAIGGSLRTLAGALKDIGLRACLCYEVSDREGPAAAEAGIEENAAFLAEVRRTGGDTLRARFGLHASFTLSDSTLEACVKAVGPETDGFHIHVAEDRIDQEMTQARHSLRVVERLERAGILGPKTLCVHGVHLEDHEVAILARSGTWLVHCPESNMNNAVGAASLARLREGGVRLALGTDGFTANLVREILVAHLLQNHLAGDPRSGYGTIPELPFSANAALAAETFGLDLGRLRPGGPADLVVWDYRPPTPLRGENLWGHILFGLVSARAEEVLVAGRQVLEGGRVLTCDELALASRCQDAARRLWERF